MILYRIRGLATRLSVSRYLPFYSSPPLPTPFYHIDDNVYPLQSIFSTTSVFPLHPLSTTIQFTLQPHPSQVFPKQISKFPDRYKTPASNPHLPSKKKCHRLELTSGLKSLVYFNDMSLFPKGERAHDNFKVQIYFAAGSCYLSLFLFSSE